MDQVDAAVDQPAGEAHLIGVHAVRTLMYNCAAIWALVRPGRSARLAGARS